jgi:hypothetical protein
VIATLATASDSFATIRAAVEPHLRTLQVN